MRLITLILLALCQLPAQTFNARVIHIADGDTVTVSDGREQFRIRLAEIDCPELNQPWGNAAKQLTATAIAHQVVHVVGQGSDRYGRLIAHITEPDGTDLNAALVAAGLAWHYTRYSTSTLLHRLERQAQDQHRGLWQDAAPVPPWDWRRMCPER